MDGCPTQTDYCYLSDKNRRSISAYVYDSEGQRLKKVVDNEVTIFVYDAGGRLVAEYTTTTPTSPQVNYLTTDTLGSPRINTAATGAVIARHDLLPYGKELTIEGSRSTALGYGPDGTRQKFTTYSRDTESDLDHANARMYSNLLGRFSTADPILLSVNGHNPQTWNRYVYVLNNPYIYTDPLGLWAIASQAMPKKPNLHIGRKEAEEVGDDGDYGVDDGCQIKNGKGCVVTVYVGRSQEGDDGARLAAQLGLRGGEAAALAAEVGDSWVFRLSESANSSLASLFGEIENNLLEQMRYSLTSGPVGNCAGTACRLALGRNFWPAKILPKDMDTILTERFTEFTDRPHYG